MKAPRGFAKNYFTFSAIQAYSVHVSLHSQISRVAHYLETTCMSEPDNIEKDEPPMELLTPTLVVKKPCHCNCFFNLKTRLALLINLFIPRCPYYTVCFAFRRSGVHPPH